MTIFRFDPAPGGIALSLPMLVLMSYITWRGFARREFRIMYRWGWHKLRPGSFDYAVSTLLNLILLGAFALCLHEALFNGSNFYKAVPH
jgi:hypothetical protein